MSKTSCIRAARPVPPEPSTAAFETGPGERIPERVRSLRWEDAPSVLTQPEAAAILRRGEPWLSQRTEAERVQIANGFRPDNPIPVVSDGRRKLYPRDMLKIWFDRECLRQLRISTGQEATP